MASYDNSYASSADDYHLHAQHQHAGAAPVSITRSLRNPPHGAGLALDMGSRHSHMDQGAQHYAHEGQQQQYYGGAGEGYHADEDEEMHSDDEVAEALQGGGQHRYQYHHHDEDDLNGQEGENGSRVEGAEEDIDDDTGSFSDSLSSSPSIPDEDIDFNLVYALHTFLATVDGQASVVKGDKLLLLDDSNSYWWLVRVLKTQAIGYIPAENIETPWERLARLNKHRNVDLTSATQADVLSGPTSTVAQTRFVGRIPPSQQPHPHESRHPFAKGVPASPSHKDHPRNISPPPEARPASSKAKTVLFTAPTYYAHSASGLTSEDDDGGEHGPEGYAEGHEDDYGQAEEGGDEGGFEEDEEDDEEDGARAGGEESEFSDDHDDYAARAPHAAPALAPPVGTAGAAAAHAESDASASASEEDEDAGTEARRGHSPYALDEGAVPPEAAVPSHEDEIARREHWERERDAALQAQQQAAAAEAHWMRQEEEAAQRPHSQAQSLSPPSPGAARRTLSPADLAPSPPHVHAADLGLGLGLSPTQTQMAKSPSAGGSSTRSRFSESDFADPAAPTKKLSATPPIARVDAGGEPPSSFDELLGLDRAHAGERTSYLSAASGSQREPPQRVRGVDLVDPRDPRYNRMLQPTKQAGEDVVYERMVALQQREHAQGAGQARPASGEYGAANEADTSVGSVDAPAAAIAEKRASTGGKGDDKKRKSGGGILGLFRKKDKKKKTSGGADDAAAGRDSEESARASPTSGSFRRSTSSSPGGSEPRSSADRSSTGHGAAVAPRAQPPQGATTAEAMFSTDAALRQQELEARQALFHQYGVQRAPGDVSNTMTPRGAPGVHVVTEGQAQQSPQMSLHSGGGTPRVGGVGGGGSNSNSLQLLNYPGSGIGPNGALASPSSLAPPQRMRPGSLIGSPSIPGLEVPLLSVMRVFAGAHIDSEATFKTVLLNQSTTAADLVKQAMQRFRLTGSDLTREDFYLTVKELGGDERALGDGENPLQIFEELSDRAGDEGFQLPPSVKRSSIGSITSISSNLSLNPAITRSGVSDWSDDSAVKFYLHRRGGPSSPLVGSGPGEQDGDGSFAQQSFSEDASSDHTATPQLGGAAGSGPSYRFAVRLLIHPADLPENVVFDPSSTAIIPRAVLAERQSRNGGFAEPSPPPSGGLPPREKIIFFPRNANVSEVIETALDRFGIVDGVVDGGDEVEDRVNRRRSQSRVKYSLAVQRDGRESYLNASSKLLEAYSTAPLFKAYDRSSKEFRRRSADATLILGTAGDVQPHDPVFVIRRSPARPGAAARGVHPQTIDELEELQQRRRSMTETAPPNDDDEPQEVLQGSPNPEAARGTSQRDLIAAQRAAQRANQRAILSARGNADQGFDIMIPEQGTIRSARREAEGADEVRYSFVHQDGTEVDISEIVEDEWQGGAPPPPQEEEEELRRPTETLSRAVSAATTTDAESFVTVREAPLPTEDEGDDPDTDEDERRAIDALRSTSVEVDRRAPSAAAAQQAREDDHLRSALGPRPMTSPIMNESLQERLDRVLARVKEDKARRAASPIGSYAARPLSLVSNGSAVPSGRTSPASVNVGGARSASALSGRRSPFGDILRDSPSIDQLIAQSPRAAAHAQGQASSPRQGAHPRSVGAGTSAEHGKKASIASLSSAASASTAPTEHVSTPVTAGSSNAFTPASSANSNHRQIAFRDDYGFDTLATIVAAAARPPSAPKRRDSVEERLFGRELDVQSLHPEVRSAYEAPAKAFNDLDARLDDLLRELIRV
ncbi:protein phosphatase regulator [Rhodotorula kratochvilovae]